MTFPRIVIPLHRFALGMISAQTRSADIAKENRHPVFRIMLYRRCDELVAVDVHMQAVEILSRIALHPAS